MMKELTAADGHVFDVWIAPTKGPRRGGLVIVQEIFGVTDQLKAVAARYAALGYEVAVPALFDRVERSAVLSFDEIDRARGLMQKISAEGALADLAATVAVLGGRPAVMGFCWGGGLALRTAQTLDIGGAVVFYGTRIDSYLDRPLTAPVQGHFGLHDDHVPPALLDRARAFLGAEFEVFTYDAGHAFANDERPSYVAEAAETAHARAEAFLARHAG